MLENDLMLNQSIGFYAMKNSQNISSYRQERNRILYYAIEVLYKFDLKSKKECFMAVPEAIRNITRPENTVVVKCKNVLLPLP